MPLELSFGRGPLSRQNPLPVSADLHVFAAALTLDTAAYVAGDTLADALEVPMPTGWNQLAILHDVFVMDEDDQGQAFDILVFDKRVTTSAKNAVWNTSDADLRSCLAIVRVTSGDWVDLGGNRIASVANLGRFLAFNGSSILIYTVSQGTGTYTAAGLRLKLGFLR